ncbi:hypothetical protein [Shimia sp. MMG029]|uniref:hypothetical protein n=1 Tax=Shimia sp. MMG029 TaxID=3021978 RepID=UPI0022FED37A|nr:hypothetical protein [Shimia sp. MMG029]MDA5555415.1 hypothetical protein [Shimia sp. MMG029]
MAKRHKSSLVTASFHYLIKTAHNEKDPGNPLEAPFTPAEFQQVVDRISTEQPLNEKDPAVVENIKSGRDLPFSGHSEIETGLHFGNFDGAYYGQQYRNNVHGVISAESLNLRPFNYLITRLRDGRILVGVTYHGQFGDYDGLRSCLTHLLGGGNYQVTSRTIKSISGELGNGVPTEIKLIYRKESERPEQRNVFGRSGIIAIKGTEYGDGFGEEIGKLARNVRGSVAQRKRVLADIVNQGELIELNEQDIIGCTALVREHGRTRTVYFLGENNFSTKFALNVSVDKNGVPDRGQIQTEMIKAMRDKILPLLA